METIRFGKIGLEDLATGRSQFEATLADGQIVTLNEINSLNLAQQADGADSPFLVCSNNFQHSAAYSSVADAITAIGSSTRTLIIPQAATIDADLTIPYNVTTIMWGTGVFSVNSGVTLTINGPLHAACGRQIFSGSGTVVGFGKVPIIYPDWWTTNATPGTTDMSTAVQAAFNAADAIGSQVRLLPTTYLISSQLAINGTITVQGSGWATILKVDSSASRFIPILVQGDSYAAVNGVVLRDFKLDGSSKCTLDAGMIQMNNAVGFLVEHLWLTSGGTPGESGSQGVNGLSFSAGSLGQTASQGVVRDCLVEATTKAGINVSTESLNISIVNNIVRSCTGNTQTPGIQVLGGYNAKIIGNSVYSNQGYGIFVGTSGGSGTYRFARYALIESNHVYSNGQGTTNGAGIFVANAGVAEGTFGRIRILNNTVYSNGVNVNSDGIHIQNDNNIFVENNYCYNNSLSGIKVEAATNVKVSHNVCEDNNTSNTSNVSGIYVLGSASVATDSIEISYNKCFNSSNQKYPVYIDNSNAGTFTNVTVVENESEGHATSDGINMDYMPVGFYLRHRFQGQTTTDATAKNICYATLNDNSVAHVTIKTVGIKSDGSDRAIYHTAACAYRDGGAATLQGAVQSVYAVESNASWAQTIDVSSNSVRGRITGIAATTITWNHTIEIDAI